MEGAGGGPATTTFILALSAWLPVRTVTVCNPGAAVTLVFTTAVMLVLLFTVKFVSVKSGPKSNVVVVSHLVNTPVICTFTAESPGCTEEGDMLMMEGIPPVTRNPAFRATF